MSSNWLLWVLIVGSVASLTRLVVKDAVTEAPRSWLISRAGEHQKLTYVLAGAVVAVSGGVILATGADTAVVLLGSLAVGLVLLWGLVPLAFVKLVSCPWCVSMWVSVGVLAVALEWSGSVQFTFITGALAVRYLVGLAATWEEAQETRLSAQNSMSDN